MKFLLIILISLVPAFCTAQNNKDTSSVPRPDNITGAYAQKLVISKQDSTMYLYANIRKDYITFGYEKPDTKSKKMILFSIFTDYVKNNPFNCLLGSYYETSSLNFQLKFISTKGAFVKCEATRDNSPIATIYFLKKCVVFIK